MLEYFTAALREGDTTSHGEYELRYTHEYTGARGGRHVIEAHHPEDGRAGRMEWMGRPPYAIHNITVEPEHQRRGLATAMWNWAQENARPKPRHSEQRTDAGDAWARSVGGRLPRRTSRLSPAQAEGLFPSNPGHIVSAGISEYFGGGHGAAAHPGRTAGRGKPRRDRNRQAPPGGGEGGPAAGQQRGQAGEGGARLEGPRPVEFHPAAHKDLKALDKPVQKQIKGVIEGLARGDQGLQTHALTQKLSGWYSTKASRGHRVVHRPTDDGGIHVGYIGLHDYDKAIRRLTSRGTTIRHVPPEEYRRPAEGVSWKGSVRKRAVKVAKRDVMEVAPYLGDVWRDNAAEDFRRVVFTSPLSQFTLMTLQPGEDIGEETHADVDQILVLLEGSGRCLLETDEMPFTGNAVLCVPRGVRHNIMNGEDGPMRLATVYAPAHHAAGTVHHTKDDAAKDTKDEYRKRALGRREAMNASPGKGPLPINPGKTWYRLHYRPRAWSDATSAEMSAYDPTRRMEHTRQEGFSAFGDPHTLDAYLEEMRWYDHLREHDPEHRNHVIVQFPGEHTGRHGANGEPLVKPGPRADRVEIPIKEFWDRLEETPRDDEPGSYRHQRDAPRRQMIEHLQTHHPAAARLDASHYTADFSPWSYHDVLHGPKGEGIEHDHTGLVLEDPQRRRGKTAAHPRPTSRIFGPTYGLDHRLFAGGKLKPEVRAAVMARLGPVIEPLLGDDWQRYTKVYLAGSEASEWTSETLEGNGDFDTLIGVDYDALKGEPGVPVAHLDDQDITDALNKALREDYNASPWKAPFGGEWDLTGYCNAGAYDIRRIKPYAAYNITDDEWAVRPIHDPEWGLSKFPEGGDNLVAEAEGYAAVVEAISKMPEPFQTQQGKALWKHLHSDRSRAFSDEGEGFVDPGNAIEKILVEWGVWDKLVEWQYGPQKTAAGGYGVQHRPQRGGAALHEVDRSLPDAYLRPQQYLWGDEDGEALAQVRQARGNPEHLVTIYRAAPRRSGGEFNPGDWVSLSHAYAQEHADARNPDPDADPDDFLLSDPPPPEEHYHVYRAQVPAAHVRTGGNDLVEWGYWGDALKGEHSPACATPHQTGKTAAHQEPWVEHVRVDKLFPHREWQHQPGGFSYTMDGDGPYAPKYDAESWEANKRSVAEEGVREPLTLKYNPTTHSAYLGEGNHRLHWARELGHQTVPVRMWRTSEEMPERYRLQGRPKLTKDEHGYFPQGGFKPSDVLPADYFPSQEKTAAIGPDGKRRDRARQIQPDVYHSDALTSDDAGWARKVSMLEYFTAADDDEHDYRMQHRPPDTDFGSPHHDISEDVMPGLYDNPEWHDHSGESSYWDAFRHVLRTRGKPEAKVTIYRSLPAEHAHQGFRPGDWVSTSEEYARRHGQQSDPEHDWPVIRTTVPAKHLQTEGNDLREWGYTGPHKDMPTISYKGGYHQEVRHDKDGRIKPVKRRKPKTASAELEMRTRKGRRKGIGHTFEPEEDRGPGYMVRYPGTAKTADYRLQHQAPDEESGKPYHHFFGGDPDEEVRIYRAAPHGVNSLHSGSWVTTDPDYAHQHAEQYDGSEKWPVMSATVPARHLYWDENDEHEFGYQGPALESRYLEEHDQETGGLQPFRDREGVYEEQAPAAPAPTPKRRVRSIWGSSVAHLSPQDHADSLMGPTREHVNKVLQGMGPVKWAEHHSHAERDAISGLDEARTTPRPGTKPVGVLVRKQGDQITGVQLKHHGGDLPEGHMFAGMDIPGFGAIHDLSDDPRPVRKQASMSDYFGMTA